MLKKILLAGVVLVVGVVTVAALRDGRYTVTRSRLIAAPVKQVFPYLADLRKFPEWSPWAKLDPQMQVTADEGNFAWKGNSKVGEGKMTRGLVAYDERVDVALEFLKPFASQSTVSWTVKPEGDKTLMTWTMRGENKGLVQKTFGMLIPMDAVVGKDFEAGLANLEKVVTASPPVRSEPETGKP